jgi:hypothetical protein
LESDGKEIHLEILSKLVALGYQVKEIPAHLQVRRRGVSKTKLRRTSATHLFYSLLERPLLLFSAVGVLLVCAGVAIAIDLTYLWLQKELNPGRPILFIMVILLLSGFQFLSFGIISFQNQFLRNELFRLQSRVKRLDNSNNSRSSSGDNK